MKLLHAIAIVLFVVCTFLSIVGMWWLAISLILLSGFSTIRFLKGIPLLYYSTIFFYVFLVAVWTRTLVSEFYLITSSSMEDSIQPGELIMVNKLAYGPKVPNSISEIPLLNLFSPSKPEEEHELAMYRRLAGYSRFTKGEIILYLKDEEVYVKRCIALPGDTVQIISGQVFVNSSPIKENEKVKKRYRIWPKTRGGPRSRYSQETPSYDSDLNFNQLTILSSKNDIDSIRVLPIKVDTINRTYYHNKFWSEDYFGPYIVPRKGYTIPMDTNYYWQYSRVINRSEGPHGQVIKRGDKIFQGEVEIQSYTFEKDYYFVLGDNRTNSNDSRYAGAISEEKIIGKAFAVVFSKGHTEIRWKRIWKLLH